MHPWNYEDNASGRLSDERFSMMSKTYEDEQASLKAETARLREEIEVQERQTENIEQFIQMAKKYADLDGITPYALRELVSAIYVEAPDKSSGHRVQCIHICYDLVGFIPLDELIKQGRHDPQGHAVPKNHIAVLCTPGFRPEGFYGTAKRGRRELRSGSARGMWVNLSDYLVFGIKKVIMLIPPYWGYCYR